jgi:hypothetical protein
VLVRATIMTPTRPRASVPSSATTTSRKSTSGRSAPCERVDVDAAHTRRGRTASVIMPGTSLSQCANGGSFRPRNRTVGYLRDWLCHIDAGRGCRSQERRRASSPPGCSLSLRANRRRGQSSGRDARSSSEAGVSGTRSETVGLSRAASPATPLLRVGIYEGPTPRAASPGRPLPQVGRPNRCLAQER